MFYDLNRHIESTKKHAKEKLAWKWRRHLWLQILLTSNFQQKIEKICRLENCPGGRVMVVK